MRLGLTEKARNGRRTALLYIRNKSETVVTDYDPKNIFVIADWIVDGRKATFFRSAKAAANLPKPWAIDRSIDPTH